MIATFRLILHKASTERAPTLNHLGGLSNIVRVFLSEVARDLDFAAGTDDFATGLCFFVLSLESDLALPGVII